MSEPSEKTTPGEVRGFQYILGRAEDGNIWLYFELPLKEGETKPAWTGIGLDPFSALSLASNLLDITLRSLRERMGEKQLANMVPVGDPKGH